MRLFLSLLMSKLRLLLTLLIGVFAFPMLAHAQNAAPESPVKWEAQAPTDIRAGEGGQIVVTATIKEGWYIYAPSTPPGGPNPTTLKMAEGSALEIKGKIAQPAPYTHFDEGFQMNTETFKRAVSFGVPVMLKAGASGAQKATLKARYQACDARVCNPPKTVELPLNFTVAAGAARPDKAKADDSVPAQTVVQAEVAKADVAKGDDQEKVAATTPATNTPPTDGAGDGNQAGQHRGGRDDNAGSNRRAEPSFVRRARLWRRFARDSDAVRVPQ